MAAEEWRDVPGFEGELVASSEGRIARLIGFPYSGYEAVSVATTHVGHPVLTGGLSSKGESFTIATHRIIALTFLGEPPEGRPHVNHKDGTKKNNAVANLEWCSVAENLAHARGLGLLENAHPPMRYTREQYESARLLWATGQWTLVMLAAHLKMTVGGMHHAIHKSKKWRQANG